MAKSLFTEPMKLRWVNALACTLLAHNRGMTASEAIHQATKEWNEMVDEVEFQAEDRLASLEIALEYARNA